MLRRTLGPSAIEVSALGMGCWAIGGPFLMDGIADGWGAVDDDESTRAVQRALDLGVTLFDTADVYGTGHSERVLGAALGSRRTEAVIATKFGYTYDEAGRAITGTNTEPAYIRRALERSLRRLGTDYIDLYQLHVGGVPPADAEPIWATLDQLRQEGLIRAYGWSTGSAEHIDAFGRRGGGATAQYGANVLQSDPALFAAAEAHRLAILVNSPLAMGLLSGKFDAGSRLPADDVRGSGHSWVPYFSDGRPRPELLAQLAAIREVLTSGGRTLAQGALAWLWARSGHAIPIPGFKTVRQVEDNAGALARGPLTAAQMAEIDALLVGLPAA